ncbi:MAG: DUF5677 domain-containing protein [Methanotrichaceae archaeon]
MSGRTIDLNAEIPRLHSVAVDLAGLAIDILKNAKHDEYDHFAFMASNFVCKQLTHLRSVLKLVDAEQYMDALSIARAMAEGFAILLWAKGEPIERPLNWRAFVCIDQFRHDYGLPIYSEHKEYLDIMLDKFCRKYLKPEFKDKPQIEIVPDNYRSSWKWDDDNENKFVKVNVEKIFEETGLKDLHEGLYDPASGWIHWDSFSMRETVERKSDGSKVCGNEPKYVGAWAIASGFHALFGTASLLDEYLKLGYPDQLIELYRKAKEYSRDEIRPQREPAAH